MLRIIEETSAGKGFELGSSHGSEMACRKLAERKRIERLPLDQTSIHNI